MRKIQLFLWLVCTNIYTLCAIEGLKFESITNKEGLSHNTVRGIMQDSRGFMWISTVNGLNRYDGHTFSHSHPGFNISSLTENNVRQTKEDRKGRIWVQTTSRFINCYDTRTEQFVDYTGKNEVRNYRKVRIMLNNDVWLWGLENGACHIRYQGNEMLPTLYDINNIGTNVVGFVLNDQSGETWIGTDKGLIQIINQIPKSTNTGNRIYSYEKAIELNDRIFFFTNNGVILAYNKSRKVFLPTIDMGEWKDLKLNDIMVLDDNHILIAGKQATLILNAETLKLTSAKDYFNGEMLQNTSVYIDNRNNGWIYNKTGNIWRYRKDLQKFEKLRLIPEPIMSVIDLERYEVYCDSREITWITTYGNGLFAIEKTGQVSHFTTANSGLKTNYLLSVSEDMTNDIWIGTENTGISKISLTKYNNKVFLPEASKTENSERTIRSIFEDKNTQHLWIGTKNGDIYVFDKEMKQKSKFALGQGTAYSITSDTIGNIWIGTKGNGLLVIPAGGITPQITYSHHFSDDHKTGANNIYTVLCDQKGRMWVGTFGSGLYLCELKNSKFQITSFPSISNKQKQIRCLVQDHSGLIWAGGEYGIVVFNPDSLLAEDDHFEWLHFDRSNPRSLNNNIVKSIFEDSRKRIWIGTSGGGLNLAIRDSTSANRFSFNHYTLEEGLINNMVQAILEDQNGNLWISTENGMSKFDPTNFLFENYNFLDTWESDLFCESTAFKRENGELLFGSFNGMYIFDPASFESQAKVLPVMLTGLTINGSPVKPNSADSPLTESITQTHSIRLKNGQNSFGIEFSSLNFQSSHSNRYTYILENYDKEWNPITKYNVATYKNIPAGKYVFKVRNINNAYESGSTETRLEIIVVPPFWRSGKALLLYLVLLIAIGYFIVRFAIKMNKLNNEVEVEKQLTELRLRFFTNISHEFRTPLTIIRGSIESMNKQNQLPAALKKNIDILERSSSKLMRLIDQLLEFRKMQNAEMDLRIEHTEVVSFLKGIYDMFAETAERKGINFTFASDKQSGIILLDKGKMEKIAFNLLSNAFKHTPEKGFISMTLHFNEGEGHFTLKVADSGIGIPPEKRHLLFVRFKQINYSASGMGIGLHLTAELTQIHKGQIEYSDSEWGGACFTVGIPTSCEAYHANEIVQSSPATSGYQISSIVEEHEIQTGKQYAEASPEKKYTLLLIEDDEEVRSFLEDQLKEFFAISTAPNGLAGWETAINEQSSLIVCDVMMPGMDGFEVTRKLKSDFQTSHIPIILLTAHSSIEHQLEGINAGADAYIIKPFSMEYLVSRIIKLIEQREKLQYKFAHEPGMIQTTICTTDKDNAFIQKIHEIIETRMDNPDFSIDDFAQAVSMSRTIFYKKIKGITNCSPNEYLRIVRLKKAAELLKTADLNISEVAYKVGFNDPDYFSKCFREQFGMRPTQFRNADNE